MKRRDITFGASWGFAVAGLVALGWAIYSFVTGASPVPVDEANLVMAGLGLVYTLGLFVGSLGVVVPTWLLIVSMVTPFWLSYRGLVQVSEFINEGLIWVVVGLVALTWATMCQVAAQTSGDRPEKSRAGSAQRNPAFWVAAAASVTATALIAQLFMLHASPLQAQQATELAEAPPLPRNVLGEVIWVTSIPGDSVDNAAGTRGPVVAMSDGVVGLDSSDGSVAWQRRRSGRHLCSWTESPQSALSLDHGSNHYLLVSQNRRFVAYTFCAGDGSRYEVLDTMTGALVLEGSTKDHPIGQLTDEVLWVNGQGISLSDGKVLWEKPITNSMMATSSKLLDIPYCSFAQEKMLCTVVTLDHNDPANRHTYDDVSINYGLATQHMPVQGWVAQLTPGAEPPGENTDVTMQALNLETGETVPLGEFMTTRAVSATQLVLQHADDTLAVFDPTSRTVTELEKPASSELGDEDLPLPEVHGPDWDISKYSRYSRNMRVYIADREVTIPVELPAGVARHVTSANLNSTPAWLAPGCLMVQGQSVNFIAAGKGNANHAHLPCLR